MSCFGDAERSFIIKVIVVTLKACINRKPVHVESVFGIRLRRFGCLCFYQNREKFSEYVKMISLPLGIFKGLATSEWQTER